MPRKCTGSGTAWAVSCSTGDDENVLSHTITRQPVRCTVAGTRSHKYWLAEVVKTPWELKEPKICDRSHKKFDKGERVLKVIWYHRVDGERRIFRYAPELGEFLVPEICYELVLVA